MLLTALEQRRSRRAISPEELDTSLIEELIEASRLAPSCMNRQSWRHLFAVDQKLRETIAGTLTPGNYWALHAPLFVVSAFHPDLGARLDDGRDYAAFELGLSLQNILLQGIELGLVAHPMAGFSPLELKERLGIDSAFTVMAVTAIGKPGSIDGLNDNHRLSEQSGRNLKDRTVTVALDAWTHLAPVREDKR